MSNTDYASAVAAVRAMESSLITQAEMEQFISAPKSAELRQTQTLDEAWEVIKSAAPDCRELEILLYRNDFHNLKAAMKCLAADSSPDSLYIRPTSLDLEKLSVTIGTKRYEELPDFMQSAAAEGYELITNTLDGQLFDIYIDKAALSAMQYTAELCGSDFMIRYANLVTACADITTAYRLGKMHRGYDFILSALCGSPVLSAEALARAAVNGVDSLSAYLESSGYADASAHLSESAAAFEKWCGDSLTELAESARYKAFGVEPLAAYFIAKEAEITNLRIISVCKSCGADKQIITERMRKLYV